MLVADMLEVARDGALTLLIDLLLGVRFCVQSACANQQNAQQ